MQDKREHIARLFIRQFFNKASEADRKELKKWRDQDPTHEQWFSQVMNPDWLTRELHAYASINKEAGLARIEQLLAEEKQAPVRTLWSWKSLAVAASLVLVAGIGWWFVNKVTSRTGNIPAQETVADIQVVSTPLQQQQEVKLADGSTVWLNAGSTISYKAGLTGAERRITMTGEAYFDVARDERPFEVEVNGVIIKALGTRFNVNAYANEMVIKTTLLEGKLSVTQGNMQTTMKAGDQASIDRKTGKIGVLTVPNAEQVIAWKKGLFEFDNADVPSVMRQLNHWYGVTVIYKTDTPATRITAIMNRSITIDKALKLLEKNNGIHTEIHDNQITVLP
jgi:ferric-dicitrate binding protein FerR (iron transport regulator)